MIPGLVRHHILFREMPKLAAVAIVTAVFATNIVMFLLAVDKDTGMAAGHTWLWLQLVVTAMAAGGLVLRGGHRRTAPWYLGLPIPGETLWRSHCLALLAGMLGLLLAQMAVALGFLKLMSLVITSIAVPWGELVAAFVNPALVLVFTAGLVAARRPELADQAEAPGWLSFRWVVVASGLGLVVLLHFLPPVAGLVPAAAGVLAAARSRRKLPPCLSLGNGSSRALAGSVGEAWEKLATAPRIYRPRRLYLGNAILDQLFKVPYRYFALLGLFIAFFGAIMGGWDFYGSRVYPEILRGNNFFITIYLLFALTGEFVLRLHKIDALPVSRTSLLVHLVLPGLIFLVAGYGAARIWEDYGAPAREYVKFQDAYGKYGVAVSPGFYGFDACGDTLQVAAPWGESHAAVARHPVPRHPSPWALQSPFLTDGGPTSEGFLAWQLSRAVEHVYGRRIDPEELAERYIEVDRNGEVIIPEKPLTVARDYGLTPRSGGPVSAFLLGPLVGLYLLATAAYFALLRRDRTVRWARVVWWGFMGGLFLLHILQVFGQIMFWNKLGGAALVFSAARMTGELGLVGHVLAYAAALAVAGLAWRLCLRTFRDLEAPR